MSPEPSAWVPVAEPLVQIGVRDGDERYLLFRVQHAKALPDGRIAVADGGSNRVLVYDSTGAFLLSVGGRGDGPGEFRSVNWIGVGPEDSIFVYDRSFPGSISVYNSAFEYARRMTLPSPPGEHVLLGAFADGSWLIWGVGTAPPNPAEDTAWDHFALYRANHLGAFDAIPGARPYSLRYRGGRLIYAPFAAAMPIGDRIVYTRSDRRQIEVYTRDGRLERVGRIDSPPKPTTNEMREAFESTMAPTQNAAVVRRLGNYRIAEVMPWYNTANRTAALVAGSGAIWIQQYAYPEGSGYMWDVFDESARFHGTVRLPMGFRVFQIEPDHVLGLWKDEFGVEYVQVLSLTRS